MELPIRVRGRMGWSQFLFWIVLDSILTAFIAFGPPVGLYHLLSPHTFFERLIGIGVSAALFFPCAFGAFFFWAYFITETTNW